MSRRWHAPMTAALLTALAAAVGLTGPAPRPAAAQPAPASAAALPADLAMVPADALGFVHVRLADVWKHESMKQYRAMLEKAGPRAIAALDAQFVPPPSTIDRATAVVLGLGGDRSPEPLAVVVLSFAAPFDPAKVREAYLPDAQPKTAGGKTYYTDGKAVAVHFPDNKTVLLGDEKTVPLCLTQLAKGGAPSAAVKEAAAGHALYAAVNVAKVPFPPGFTDTVPPDFQPLLKADALTLTLDLAQEATVSARLTYPTGADADAALAAAKKAADLGRAALVQPRKQAEDLLFKPQPGGKPRPLTDLPEVASAVFGLGALATLDEQLADLPVKRDGTALAASVTVPAYATPYVGMSAVSVGLLLPAVQKVREAAARAQSQNNLKQIALAMHNYESAYGSFPPAAVVDKKGRKLLSWRVTVLPFLEQQPLYNQFKLDEPWDSDHNKKLIPLMPKVYADPRVQPGPGETYYKVFVGKDAGFDWLQGRKFAEFTDGMSNTIMAAAGGDPVVWTKPDDIEFDPAKPLPDLTKPFGNLQVAMCDGSVRFVVGEWVKKNERMMKLLIQRNDGQPVSFDD